MSSINLYPLAAALMLLGKYFVPLRAGLSGPVQQRSPTVMSRDKIISIPKAKGAPPRKPSAEVPVVIHTILMKNGMDTETIHLEMKPPDQGRSAIPASDAGA